MDNNYLEPIKKYFDTLSKTGYIRDEETYASSVIQFLYDVLNDGSLVLTDEDRDSINGIIECLRNRYCVAENFEFITECKKECGPCRCSDMETSGLCKAIMITIPEGLSIVDETGKESGEIYGDTVIHGNLTVTGDTVINGLLSAMLSVFSSQLALMEYAERKSILEVLTKSLRQAVFPGSGEQGGDSEILKDGLSVLIARMVDQSAPLSIAYSTDTGTKYYPKSDWEDPEFRILELPVAYTVDEGNPLPVSSDAVAKAINGIQTEFDKAISIDEGGDILIGADDGPGIDIGGNGLIIGTDKKTGKKTVSIGGGSDVIRIADNAETELYIKGEIFDPRTDGSADGGTIGERVYSIDQDINGEGGISERLEFLGGFIYDDGGYTTLAGDIRVSDNMENTLAERLQNQEGAIWNDGGGYTLAGGTRIEDTDTTIGERLNNLESINAEERLSNLEGINAEERLGNLENINAEERLGNLEGFKEEHFDFSDDDHPTVGGFDLGKFISHDGNNNLDLGGYNLTLPSGLELPDGIHLPENTYINDGENKTVQRLEGVFFTNDEFTEAFIGEYYGDIADIYIGKEDGSASIHLRGNVAGDVDFGNSTVTMDGYQLTGADGLLTVVNNLRPLSEIDPQTEDNLLEWLNGMYEPALAMMDMRDSLYIEYSLDDAYLNLYLATENGVLNEQMTQIPLADLKAALDNVEG